MTLYTANTNTKVNASPNVEEALIFTHICTDSIQTLWLSILYPYHTTLSTYLKSP